MSLKEIFVKHREIAQIIYGVILIILIPVLLAYNTISIIQRYNISMDTSIHRHALVIARTINALVGNELDDDKKIQAYIERLKNNNPDLLEINILFPTDGQYIIKHSSNHELVNKLVSSNNYNIAWSQALNNGIVTDTINQNYLDGSNIFSREDDTRFWLASMPLFNDQNQKIALLSFKISSEIVDQLTKSNRNKSVVILFVSVLITILFLAAAVRLWDYALLYKKIKELDQMKDEFISMASHELRTPITGIKGYSSMMLDGTLGVLNDQVKNGAQIINNASNRLAALVEDLLNVSRIEQKRMEFKTEDISVNKIIESIIDELKVQADAKKLELVFLPHTDELPAINIDPEKLKQILINLIGNSIKYTEKGKVEVLCEEKNKGKTLEIRIKDTGIGMSAKARENLFQKFYRVKNEKTEKITGTGLGLWITKQLVELQKGKIMVDSIENVGTQMTLQFPVAKEK